MDILGTIVFSIVGTSFVGFAVLVFVLNSRATGRRVPVDLLVTDVEQYSDKDGDTFFRSHYMVLYGPHEGKRGVSPIGFNPAHHEKHEYLKGVYDPVDGAVLSHSENKWENRAPFFLSVVGTAMIVAGWLFF